MSRQKVLRNKANKDVKLSVLFLINNQDKIFLELHTVF